MQNNAYTKLLKLEGFLNVIALDLYLTFERGFEVMQNVKIFIFETAWNNI